MGEMIDRDDLVKRIASVMRLAKSDAQKTLLGRIILIAKNTPAVDAAPVVRCKDCKYWALVDRYDGHGYGTCTYDITVIRRSAWLNENFFCADGKQKDGGDDDANT